MYAKQNIPMPVVRMIQATSTTLQHVAATLQKIIINNQQSATIQKINSTAGGQLIATNITNLQVQKVVTKSNLHQLLQGATGQKVIVESKPWPKSTGANAEGFGCGNPFG